MKKLLQKIWFCLLLGGTAMLLFTGALMFWAGHFPDIFFSLYTPFSGKILYLKGQITGIFPFSVYELIVLALTLTAFLTGILAIRKAKPGTWLALVYACVCTGVFLFAALWGLNHLGPDAGEKLCFEAGKYTAAELKEAAEYYMNKAEEIAALLPEEEDGTTRFPSFRELSGNVRLGFDAIAGKAGKPGSPYTAEFRLLADPGARVKPLAASRLFAYTGTTGIFIAFTGEANVSTETYKAAIPFTMCHETAHRLSFAAEEEANFIAFLTCEANEKPEFQYSGHYLAFIYCFNSLYAADPSAAAELNEKMPPRLSADLRATNRHYAQFDGKVQNAAQKVNDGYLKVFGEEDGVRSYGMVTDYLIEWYLRKGI